MFPSRGSNFDKQLSSPSSPPSLSPSTSPVPNFASTTYVGPPPLIPTIIPSSNTSISSPGAPIRRPPLPTTLPSFPGSGTSSPSVKTPLASPNLATYRAPEELVNSDNGNYFAGPSTSALAPVSEQAVEAHDEDDDTETLDGHEVNEGENSTLPLIPDHGEMDEEIRTYFQEEATDGSEEGKSDTELELVIDLPEPEAGNSEQHEEPHVVDPQDGNEVAGAEVDEDEEDDEEEDEEGEDEIAEEFQARPQLREGAAVAFNAGGRRAIQLDANGDQNAHPIRDILKRAALVQLRKICISGIIYTFVVVCIVFSVAVLLFLGQKLLLPIRWKTREPLSNISIDLLFLNVALPYTMTYFHATATTSYFFGLRRNTLRKKFSLSRIVYGSSKDASILVEDYDGSFRRVPNTDDLAIPWDIPATVAVTATGKPVNEEAMILMTQQDMETVQTKHSIRQDFTAVYISPYFRYRMILFVSILWTFGALCLGTSVTLPILIG
ncbi:hypothetical protein F5876DRAFT_71934 [Lentinula aff. lateritia]|uniref:Uncharacterized protein n=1 Tax=Lentinula aff. lateritia TaxID=2804960 RepID=A0ACC1UEW1_9AGAR|nr:hypothetical protein F5876DRAFT_71934 [Lentinula aff. lateritia]